jgi:hypothetical protein
MGGMKWHVCQILDEASAIWCENGLNSCKFVEDIVNVTRPFKKHVVYGWLIIVIGHTLTIIDWLTVMIDPCVAFECSFIV